MKRPINAGQKLAAISSRSTVDLSASALVSRSTSSRRYSGTILAATRVALVRGLIEERKLRNKFLPEKMLGDAAWDILLTLYLGWCENRMTAVNTLTDATAAPRTTVLRWTIALANLNLVSRITNAEDRRVTEIRLTAAGLDAIDGYLSALHDLRT